MEIVLAQPRGFCAGVTRATKIVKGALAVYGAPVYVRHEIVHNRTVVGDLKKMGAGGSRPHFFGTRSAGCRPDGSRTAQFSPL